MSEEHRSDKPRAGDEVATVDAEQHGDAPAGGNRQVREGEIKTQRGDPAELPADVVARGHEPTDVSTRGVSLAIAGLLGGIILSVALVVAFLHWLRAYEPRNAVGRLAAERIVPSSPRLQVNPVPERLALEGAARARLRGYARLSSDPERARIPVERAMQLLAEHGWPDTDNRPVTRRLPGSPFTADARRVSPRPATNVELTPAMPIEQRTPREPPLGAPP